MKIVVAGGTGFVGRALTAALSEAGHEIVVLSRDPNRRRFGDRAQLVGWSPEEPGEWTDTVRAADAVVNLCGAGIADKRWSEARKRLLRDSRIGPTRALVEALEEGNGNSVLLSGSAVGYYGAAPADRLLDEDSPAGDDFLARLCVDWENEALRARERGVRVVLLRTGVVLGRGGGALQRMLSAFKLFAGGPVGSGKQPFPWVHQSDVSGIVRFALEHPEIDGPLNVVAPDPQTMGSFSKTLGRVLGRPSWMKVPSFAVRAMFGEGAQVVLEGQTAVPRALERYGYEFRFPELEAALREAAEREKRR